MSIKRILISLTISMIVALNMSGCNIGANMKNSAQYTIDETESKSISDIKEIVIDNSSADINIIPEDRDNIEAHLHGKVSTNSKRNTPKLTMVSEGDKITIKSKKDKNFVIGIYTSNVKLDIHIPKNYEENISIDSSSADVNIHDLNLKNYNCKLSSGDTKIKNLKVENLFYEASSGDLEGENIETKAGEIKASSGEIKINGYSGNLKARTNSGDIEVTYGKFNNDAVLEASSGDVELSLPDNAEFHLDAEVSSGDIKCGFPITVKGTGDKDRLSGTVKSDKNKIDIKTTSGDIRVNSK
ncbi:DUF4097 domain-containing protein [Clostridium ganghwense]|uniref:DUF4097 domain-containing protein n=1 Tax=Clostridium ganghwense TaxID=312089 RepID=A0ABT4CXI7_9CLOT|nr:DUF4097 domain-containing protein [Clostridium ganghwense]MCY6372736.1 DUF4097 domain-containing protein [Clostridium ganghwense]